MQIRLDSADATGANVTIQPSITYKTVPNLVGSTTTAANNAIHAAGLAVGAVNTKVDDDPLCQQVGHVITQTPAPGVAARLDRQVAATAAPSRTRSKGRLVMIRSTLLKRPKRERRALSGPLAGVSFAASLVALNA